MGKLVTFGEILLRLSPPSYLRFTQTPSFDIYYGCAEANVAASISKFGIPSKFVTAVPLNDLGEAAFNMLRSFGVEPVGEFLGKRLGIYFFEQGASERPGKVMYDREDSAFSMLKKGMIDWDSVFEDTTWFHWSGITPSLSIELTDLLEEALQKASQKGLSISVDINYRPSLWRGERKANEVMPGLIKYCDLLLGGVDESESVMGVPITELDSQEMIFSKWMEKFPKLKTIVTTHRIKANASSNRLKAFLWNGKELLHSKKYYVTHIVDRMGAGDAFMAGVIYGMLTWPENHKKTLDFAVAAACLKHSIRGDINLSSVAEVTALMNGYGGGRVLR